MSGLPSAVPQNPACGACGGETVTYDQLRIIGNGVTPTEVAA